MNFGASTKRRKTILILGILLCFSGLLLFAIPNAHAAINLVQSQTCTSSSSPVFANTFTSGDFYFSCLVTFGSVVTAGDTIILTALMTNSSGAVDTSTTIVSVDGLTSNVGALSHFSGDYCNGGTSCSYNQIAATGLISLTTGDALTINTLGLNVSVQVAITDSNYGGVPPVGITNIDAVGWFAQEIFNADTSNVVSSSNAAGSTAVYSACSGVGGACSLSSGASSAYAFGGVIVDSSGSPTVNASFTETSTGFGTSSTAAWQYLNYTSSVTSSTLFEINGDPGGNGWAAAGLVIGEIGSGSVTQPVTCTLASGGSNPNVTISLSSGMPSPSSFICDGSPHDITVPADVTFTETLPSAAGNIRYLFASSSTTYSFSTCSSGTCSGQSSNAYEQLQNTLQIAAEAQSTFDASMSITFTGTLLGTGSSDVCTITTTAFATNSCTGYSDYDEAITAPQFISSPPTHTQWENVAGSSSTAGTPTTGGNTYNTEYYKQDQNTFKVDANAQSLFDTGMSWAVTGTVLGTGSSTICTITSTAAASDSCTGYSDYDSATTIPQAASSPPSHTRWQSSSACSNTPTTGGNTYTCQSYKQLVNNYKITSNAVTDFDPSLTFTLTGTLYGVSSSTVCTMSPASNATDTCVEWADYNAAVTYPTNPTGAGAHIRWEASGTVVFTDTTGNNNHNVNYYKQLTNTYQATPSSPTTWNAGGSISVTGTVLGSSATTICTITVSNGGGAATCSGYADYNFTVTVTSPVTIGGRGWSASGSNTFTQTTGGNTNNVDYQTALVSISIVLTVADSGPVGVFGISGCDVGNGTIDADGLAHNYTSILSICAITLTVPSDGSSLRYRFDVSSAASSTLVYTTCSSGNCTQQDITTYHQVLNIIDIVPSTPTHWTGSYVFPIIGTSVSVTGSTLCDALSSSGSPSDAICEGWSDNTTTVHATVPSIINGRLTYSTTHYWTFLTGGNTETTDAIQQVTETYSVVTLGVPVTPRSGTVPTTGMFNGTGSSTICTVTVPNTAMTGSTYTCTGYSDYGLTVTQPQNFAANSTQRYSTASPLSVQPTTSGSGYLQDYNYQFDLPYTAVLQSPTTTTIDLPIVITAFQYGISETVCTDTIVSGLSSATCSGWADFRLRIHPTTGAFYYTYANFTAYLLTSNKMSAWVVATANQSDIITPSCSSAGGLGSDVCSTDPGVLSESYARYYYAYSTVESGFTVKYVEIKNSVELVQSEQTNSTTITLTNVRAGDLIVAQTMGGTSYITDNANVSLFTNSITATKSAATHFPAATVIEYVLMTTAETSMEFSSGGSLPMIVSEVSGDWWTNPYNDTWSGTVLNHAVGTCSESINYTGGSTPVGSQGCNYFVQYTANSLIILSTNFVNQGEIGQMTGPISNTNYTGNFYCLHYDSLGCQSSGSIVFGGTVSKIGLPNVCTDTANITCSSTGDNQYASGWVDAFYPTSNISVIKVYITLATSPSTLLNAITADSVLYPTTPQVLVLVNDTDLSLSAASSALGPGLVLLYFSHWSQGGGQSQTYDVIGNATLTAVYLASDLTCTGQNLNQLLNNGCIWGAGFYFWFGIFGPWILAFFEFLPALGVYVRTESPAAGVAVYVLLDVVITGGLNATVLPASLSTVGPGLLGLVISGSIFQLLRSSKGGISTTRSTLLIFSLMTATAIIVSMI